MNIQTLAQEAHQATGLKGKKLTFATLVLAGLYAKNAGNEENADYFASRAAEVLGEPARLQERPVGHGRHPGK